MLSFHNNSFKISSILEFQVEALGSIYKDIRHLTLFERPYIYIYKNSIINSINGKIKFRLGNLKSFYREIMNLFSATVEWNLYLKASAFHLCS